MIPLEQILRCNLSFISSDRSQWRTCTRRSVASGVDCGIRNALQVLVDLYSSERVPLDSGLIQTHVVNLGHPTGTVYYEVSVEIMIAFVIVCPHLETGWCAGNAAYFQTEPHINPEFASPAHQPIH
jgi:hypothetical protein